jgi:hypothetical protein
VRGLLLVSVVCLAVGVGLIFGYCNGTTGMSFGYPFSGSSLHIDITTTGTPMVIGVTLTLLGTFLLIVTWVIAIITMFQHTEPTERRKEPFLE